MSTVVDIRNLGVSFSTDAGAVKAVEDFFAAGFVLVVMALLLFV